MKYTIEIPDDVQAAFDTVGIDVPAAIEELKRTLEGRALNELPQQIRAHSEAIKNEEHGGTDAAAIVALHAAERHLRSQRPKKP